MKEIKFNPVSELARLTVKPPKPARLYIPDWYKEIPAFDAKKSPTFKKSQDDPQKAVTDRTLKLCMAFADSLGLGYIQETWQEINVSTIETNEKTFADCVYPMDPAILSKRKSGETSIAKSEHFYDTLWSWHPQWMPELPKGYSAIFTHPFNRIDLPFHTLTGIIDSDSYKHSRDKSNFPFALQKGFTGIIPIGTPMYQIIPFKRDDWESFANEYDPEANRHHTAKLRHYFWGGYKKLHWQKKTFK
jgi:hypothetical protein